jgi:hypothetical protein
VLGISVTGVAESQMTDLVHIYSVAEQKCVLVRIEK